MAMKIDGNRTTQDTESTKATEAAQKVNDKRVAKKSDQPVTQGTDKATGVTLDKVCGQVTTHNATLNAGVEVTFRVTNVPPRRGDS